MTPFDDWLISLRKIAEKNPSRGSMLHPRDVLQLLNEIDRLRARIEQLEAR